MFNQKQESVKNEDKNKSHSTTTIKLVYRNRSDQLASIDFPFNQQLSNRANDSTGAQRNHRYRFLNAF